jgi:hypothetical protein
MNLFLRALEKNPLHCDCQLVAFLTVAKATRLKLKYDDDIEPSCHSPRRLNGTLLKDLTIQNMTRNCTSLTVTPVAVVTDVVSTTISITGRSSTLIHLPYLYTL